LTRCKIQVIVIKSFLYLYMEDIEEKVVESLKKEYMKEKKEEKKGEVREKVKKGAEMYH